jgi:hypothetical protein
VELLIAGLHLCTLVAEAVVVVVVAAERVVQAPRAVVVELPCTLTAIQAATDTTLRL